MVRERRRRWAVVVTVATASAAALCAVAALPACSTFTEAADDGGAGADAEGGAPQGDAARVDGGARPLLSGERQVGRLAVDETYVYYTQRFSNGAVMRVAKSGGEATPFAPAITPNAIGIQGTTLYVTSGMARKVIAYDLVNGVVIGAHTAVAPTEIAVDAVGVIFVESGGATEAGAYLLPLALGATRSEVSTNPNPVAVALGPMNAYVAFNTSPPQVRRHTRVGGNNSTQGKAGESPIVAMDVDNSSVLFASGSKLLALEVQFASLATPTLVRDFGPGAQVTAIISAGATSFIAVRSSDFVASIYSLPASAAASWPMTPPIATIEGCSARDLEKDLDTVFVLCEAINEAGSIWAVPRPR